MCVLDVDVSQERLARRGYSEGTERGSSIDYHGKSALNGITNSGFK